MRFILASASPRRKELLQLVIPKFDIIVSTVEEKIIIEIYAIIRVSIGFLLL